MPRVLIFSLAYFPRFVGGAEVAIQEITDRLAKEGFEFHLITPRYDSTLPRQERIRGVMVHRIGFALPNPTLAELRRFPLYWNKILFQGLAVWKAWRLHRTQAFDTVWAMMAQSTGVAGGLLKTLIPSLRYVLTLQEGDAPAYIERLMRPFGSLFRRAFTKADVVQSISTFLQDWAKRMGARGRLVLIPNAVDYQRFSEVDRAECAQLQERLGKRPGERWLITTSRLVPKNAVDVSIRALSHLPPEVHLLVAGIGPEEAALRRLTANLGLDQRVHFAGEISQEHIPLYLHACDVFVRPSRSEGLGISFLEAMAAGLPVIATQEGGIRDFLFDAEKNPEQQPTGWAVDVDSPEQIAAAVKTITHSRAMTNKVIARAASMVRDQYEWKTIAERMRNEVFI
jgi:glycosyltransferase involved in cell wall biosynthesis